ncbi:hypothetical protein SNOD_00965 [Streptomyces nodosus]|uniref:Uncharacterized protein n=1 Tax=Streptomyces nodosus TaxID=40318 RepID=A0A0B5D6U8_9ACTN|nr:hypothetical protein SNOD_00965 [Streptomyces nodosus]
MVVPGAWVVVRPRASSTVPVTTSRSALSYEYDVVVAPVLVQGAPTSPVDVARAVRLVLAS